MPVDRGLLRQAVMNIYRHRFTLLQLQRRPEEVAVITPGRRKMRAKLRLSGLNRQRNAIARVGGQ